MTIGITEEHDALHDAVRGWAERHCDPSVPRAVLDAEHEPLPEFWGPLAEQGWLGLHVDEGHGGSGYGLDELVVVLEELGRVIAPGPYLPSVLAAAAIQDAAEEATAKGLLPGLAAGDLIGTVALTGAVAATDTGDHLAVSGDLRPVLCGHLASVLLVRAGEIWCALTDDEFSASELPSLDRTRRVAAVTVDAQVPPERQLRALTTERLHDLATVLFAADAVGGSQWCVEAAAQYAKDRRQFGRPIGQFQGVKHRCAEMLARTELARAATWDAARAASDPAAAAVTAVSAGALTIDAYVETAKDCIQVHGGIGFTWEHDAHLYFRRAETTRLLLGDPQRLRMRAARLALAKQRRRLEVDLPPEASVVRAEVQAFLAGLEGLDAAEQHRRAADAGYIVPQWPEPWGRDAGAVEQLVIDEEFRKAKVARPTIAIGAWAMPPLMVYGTEEQRQRWIPPTLRGEITWCQLFSEPGAGSDLASLSTRAERVEGGWVVNGQKVWTSMAQQADWGILLARTNPDAAKHDGISFFMLDMATPGIEIRPLRELTGRSMFNEVFFNDVFVPDDCLVGVEHDGWRATRTSLANERVFMGSNTTVGAGVRGVLALVEQTGRGDDPLTLAEVGGLVTTDHALRVLGFRLTLKSLMGADPGGSEASVRKLLGVDHDQRIQEVGLSLLGPDGVVEEGDAVGWQYQFLFNRALAIAGGTSEVQRNIIGERLLGLPRDP
jgi:alkylation response protein AidB-like acyl-CoA dehydrogenase